MNKTTRTIAASALIFGSLTLTGVALADSGETETDDVEALEVQFADETENTEDGGEERNRGRSGRKLSRAAAAIGIEVDELREALEAGQSIADVASDEGVPVQDVIDAMVEHVGAKLDDKVADGDLTSAEAAEKLETKRARIEDFVNNVDTDDDAEAEQIDA